MISFNKTTAEFSEIASAIKQSVIDKNFARTKEILDEIKKNGLNFEWCKDENIIHAFNALVEMGEVVTLELFLRCLIPSSADFLITTLNDVLKKEIMTLADCLIAHIGNTVTPSNGNTLLHNAVLEKDLPKVKYLATKIDTTLQNNAGLTAEKLAVQEEKKQSRVFYPDHAYGKIREFLQKQRENKILSSVAKQPQTMFSQKPSSGLPITPHNSPTLSRRP